MVETKLTDKIKTTYKCETQFNSLHKTKLAVDTNISNPKKVKLKKGDQVHYKVYGTKIPNTVPALYFKGYDRRKEKSIEC